MQVECTVPGTVQIELTKFISSTIGLTTQKSRHSRTRFCSLQASKKNKEIHLASHCDEHMGAVFLII